MNNKIQKVNIDLTGINDPLQTKINECLKNIMINKIELAFLLKSVHETKKWKSWGFRSFRSYMDTLSNYSYGSYFKYIKIARLVERSGYNPEELKKISFSALERIFELPTTVSEHIPNLLEIASHENMRVLNENIDIIFKKTHTDEYTHRVIIDFDDSLDAMWRAAERKVKKVMEIENNAHLHRRIVFEAILAEYVQGEE